MSLNHVTQTGRLTRDPELRYTNDGVPVVTINYAVDDGFGQKKKTFFFCGVAWRSTAEYIAKYAHTGDLLAISGKLQERSWEKDGVKKYRTEIVINDVVFIGKRKEHSDGDIPDDIPDDNFVPVEETGLPFN